MSNLIFFRESWQRRARRRPDARSSTAPLIGRMRRQPSLCFGRSSNDTASLSPRPYPGSLLNGFRGSRSGYRKQFLRCNVDFRILKLLNYYNRFKTSDNFNYEFRFIRQIKMRTCGITVGFKPRMLYV